MRAVDLIAKKKSGAEHTAKEIAFLVEGFCRGEMPDYQVAAWLMAVCWQGMTPRETTELTLAMVRTGEELDLATLQPPVVDKHSTGGVGDKTSLVVVPLVAAAGLRVAKMSGRGLSFTGGTLDKLESFPGFRVDLSREEFLATLDEVGAVLAGQSATLAPADGRLYALRDVTATVDSIPLIASSVMSKKVAAGAPAIVLDVKVGSGAFMQELGEARRLAELMVQIGRDTGRRTAAVLSNMDQPLGRAVGNAVEVREAIDLLGGKGPADLREHCLAIASQMLVLGGLAASPEAARPKLARLLDSGAGVEKLAAIVAAQHGDPKPVFDPEALPRAPVIELLPSPNTGYLARVDAKTIGLAAVRLGAGRARKSDPVDLRVGFVLRAKVGDRIERGQPLIEIHAAEAAQVGAAGRAVLGAYEWSQEPVPRPGLVLGTVE